MSIFQGRIRKWYKNIAAGHMLDYSIWAIKIGNYMGPFYQLWAIKAIQLYTRGTICTQRNLFGILFIQNKFGL